MNFYKLIVFPICLFLFYSICCAQTKKIELLSNQLQNTQSKNERLNILLTLFEEYQSINRDTLYTLALEANALAALQQDQNKKGLVAMALSDAYMQWGWVDSALAVLEPSLTEKNGYDKTVYYKMQRRWAMIHAARSDMEKALSILFPALSGSEKEKDTINIASIMNSIGSVKMAGGNISEALGWIQKAARLCLGNNKYKAVLAAANTNAANAYFQKKNIDSSLFYIEKAIPLCREVENLYVLATALRIKSSLLITKNKITEAENALKEMIAIRKLTRGDNFFVEDNLQLSDFYANTRQLERAIQHCRKLLQSGNVYDTSQLKPSIITSNPKIRLEYWQALSRYFKQGNRFQEYQESLEQIVILKDSFYTANSAIAMADAETKYEVQKKENTILQQKYSLQRNRFFLLGALGLFLMAIIIIYFVFRGYRQKQKVKMELAMANEKIKSINAVQNAEEKERIRIAADLHDNLGAYAASLMSNLSYIQLKDADEKTMNAFGELKNNSSAIIAQLNDTIWVLKKKSLSLTAISDRIKTFVSRLQNSYPDIVIEVEEKIVTDFLLIASNAFHLFRLLQEAVNNAIKHSKATKIKIKIESDTNWSATITDNGIGFILTEHIEKKGNGLNNMKERCKEAGWNINWNTNKVGAGTIVNISPTTN